MYVTLCYTTNATHTSSIAIESSTSTHSIKLWPYQVSAISSMQVCKYLREVDAIADISLWARGAAFARSLVGRARRAFQAPSNIGVGSLLSLV